MTGVNRFTDVMQVVTYSVVGAYLAVEVLAATGISGTIEVSGEFRTLAGLVVGYYFGGGRYGNGPGGPPPVRPATA